MTTSDANGVMPTFNPYDWDPLFYFGAISRQDAEQLLTRDGNPLGTFLIRDSATMLGDYSLSVLEPKPDPQVSHYLINKVPTGPDTCQYRIGNKHFPDVAQILNYYTNHQLETSALTKPAPRKLQRAIAEFDFNGEESRDLSIKQGEMLWIVNRCDKWWTAMNQLGISGQVPHNYVRLLDNNEQQTASIDRHAPSTPQQTSVDLQNGNISPNVPELPQTSTTTNELDQQPSCVDAETPEPRQLPAMARVIRERVPCAYWKDHLRLHVGDVIKVTKTDASGTFEGELNGKTGKFPCTYIDWVVN